MTQPAKKRQARKPAPVHPDGHKFSGGSSGFRLWHAGPMLYQITAADSFDVIDTVPAVGYFIPRAEALASLASLTQRQP